MCTHLRLTYQFNVFRPTTNQYQSTPNYTQISAFQSRPSYYTPLSNIDDDVAHCWLLAMLAIIRLVMTRYNPCLLAMFAGDNRGGTVQFYMPVIIEGVGSHLCVALCVTGSIPLCLSVRDNDGSITIECLYNM